jgi:sporulation protein YlmC with PRC-barrel domain
MNGILRASAAAVLGAAMATAPGGSGQAKGPKPVALVAVNVQAVALGYRARELIGRNVTNDRGETIGKIEDLIVGRDKVLFAIIGVGGFLGLGEHLIAVPYNSLTVTPQRIVLPGATKAAVQRLPQFKPAR